MATKPVKEFLPVTSQFEKLPYIVQLPLVGGRPCLDLVNTISWRLHPDKQRDALKGYSDLLAISLRLNLLTTEHYSELSKNSLQHPLAAARAIAEARAFRDALTQIIDAIAGTPHQPTSVSLPQETLALFNAAIKRARESENFSWARGRVVIEINSEDEAFDLPWLNLVRDADELLRSPLISRIRICAAEDCGWSFLDTSKNGIRRWCSMKTCGNRKKAERFRSR